jgi:disulfide bond formation protein DsbB
VSTARVGGLSGFLASLLVARDPARIVATVVAVGGIAAICGAWFAQYVLRLEPCSLCYAQRTPYYIAIPMGLLLAATSARLPPWASRAGCAGLGLLMIWGGSVAAYHAGVEWHWWAGPGVCVGEAGAPPVSAADLLARLQANPVVPCDVPALVVLGLSMAGWNVLFSLGLAVVALIGAVSSSRV